MNTTEKLIWNIEDLGSALGRTINSIRNDLHRKNWQRTPPPTRLAGTLVWRPKDVDAWLEQRAKESGAVLDEVSEHVVSRRRPGRPRKSC